MILAQYRGNSSPGQLADSSGNGHTLTVVGGAGPVPNPTSPTPPEGDRWLVGPSVDGESHFKVPSAVPSSMLASGAVEGDFITSLGTEPNRAVDDVLFSFEQDPVDYTKFFFCILDSTPSIGRVRFYIIQILPVFLLADCDFADTGALHHFRAEWDATGTRLYLDNLLVASVALAPLIPTANLRIAGHTFPGSSHAMDYGTMDNVIFSDNAPAQAPDIQTGQIESGQIETGALEGGGLT